MSLPIPKVAPTFLDRAISYFDPVRGAQRQHARMVIALTSTGGRGGYIGARRDRRATSEWATTGGSADADLLPDLPALRDRTRDLERNNPIGSGAIATVVSNVVGTGLIPQAQVDRELLRLTDDAADAWQRAAEREWWLWAGTPECDITRTQDFCALQDLAFRSTLANGDVFAIRKYRERPGLNPYGLKVQLLEADRVSNPTKYREQAKLDNGNTLAGGVELDTEGAPEAYHVLRQHPGDLTATVREWDRILAFSPDTGERLVHHLFHRKRVEQTRGIPYLASVIEPLKQLSRYSEAELMAAVVSAMFTVFIKTEKAEGIDTIQSPEISTSAEMAALNGLAPPSSRDAFKLAPGAMLDLLQGEDVEFANPTRPNAQFDPFTVAIWKQIGAALEVPYEIILKFFGQSYSASRAAFVLAWKFFQGRRDWLAWGFCQPFWNAVITEAVARGRLSAPGFFSDPLIRAAWCGAQWTGPPAGQIDPESEANAAEKWIELEVKTRQEVTAEITGGDWETKHRQRAREEKMRVADGLSVDPNAAPAQGGDPPPAPKRDSRASRERKQEISA